MTQKSLPPTFRKWFNHRILPAHARAVAERGAFHALKRVIKPAEIPQLFNSYGAEIWRMATADAKHMNYPSALQVFEDRYWEGAACPRLIDFQRRMIFYACDQLARDAVNKTGEER